MASRLFFCWRLQTSSKLAVCLKPWVVALRQGLDQQNLAWKRTCFLHQGVHESISSATGFEISFLYDVSFHSRDVILCWPFFWGSFWRHCTFAVGAVLSFSHPGHWWWLGSPRWCDSVMLTGCVRSWGSFVKRFWTFLGVNLFSSRRSWDQKVHRMSMAPAIEKNIVI